MSWWCDVHCSIMAGPRHEYEGYELVAQWFLLPLTICSSCCTPGSSASTSAPTTSTSSRCSSSCSSVPRVAAAPGPPPAAAKRSDSHARRTQEIAVVMAVPAGRDRDGNAVIKNKHQRAVFLPSSKQEGWMQGCRRRGHSGRSGHYLMHLSGSMWGQSLNFGSNSWLLSSGCSASPAHLTAGHQGAAQTCRCRGPGRRGGAPHRPLCVYHP